MPSIPAAEASEMSSRNVTSAMSVAEELAG
jgi:hypothetical protein